ncbi:MAG: hypothetical protein GY842_09790 [bacterium]|nr:hypothetical protein [bacterium]
MTGQGNGRRRLWFAIRLGVVAGAVLLAVPRIAISADRTVLCEEFSDKWCGACAYAGPALDDLVDVYAESLVFVQYQVFDAEYATPWGDARWTAYGVQYTPTTVFDGADIMEGAVYDSQQQYDIYRTNHLLPRRAVATDVTLGISAADLGGGSYRISVQVGLEATGVAKTVRVHIVQVLDHWPTIKPYHRNGFKQAASAQEVALTPGGQQVVERDLTLDAESLSSPEDVRIVAWAEAPVASGPAEVYQATMRHWPLVALPGDVDADGHLDGADNCPQQYNVNQADNDADGVGNACDNCVAMANTNQIDTDEDRIGELCDNCPGLHYLDQADRDFDQVGDVCDSCPDVAGDAGVDTFGRPLGGIDVDCDVDLDDLAAFDACLSGPEGEAPPECTGANFDAADTDADGDADLADFATLALNFTGPLPSPPLYVGVSECIDCHEDRHTDWSTTIHATAFDTLVNDGEEHNALCFPCHAVGYGQAGGFVDMQTTPHLAGVQCEQCHGPGSNHVADPDNERLSVDLSSNLCGACHQSCHGLCGDAHHPQFEQWSESKHANSLNDLFFDPSAADECLQCHSTDYRMAPPDAKPGLFEVFYGLECVACHSPHSPANVGQLRLPPHELCADCHTMDAAVPGEDPSQPQAEMLHGTGGYQLDGAPLEGPYTVHWSGIPDECSACHVYEQPYGGAGQPVDSGHTFGANMRACAPCHSEASAALLVSTTHEEINTRLAYIARHYDSGDPLYIDPALLSPGELAEYDLATFNYAYVEADRSFGSHNAVYARTLLTEVEAFFDIPPWPLRALPGAWPAETSAPSDHAGALQMEGRR